MKQFEEMGIKIPEILLPKETKTETWAVVACDQYTQDREYWKKAEEIVGTKESVLNLILPEIFLNNDDRAKRIEKIHSAMQNYLKNNVFAEPIKGFIYIERKTAYNRTRCGLICAIDLENYEWKPFSKAFIRATEATIVERIPPRTEIRKEAALESPHIMLLVNDSDGILVEEVGKNIKAKTPVYDGNLMLNSGSIKGWAVNSEEEIEKVRKSLEIVFDRNTEKDGSTFLFAVGDGNHSLAAAKSVWEQRKTELLQSGKTQNEIESDFLRYALVEIVNIYDKGLTFEPIHRVVFNTDSFSFIKNLSEKLSGTTKELSDERELENAVKNSKSNFGFVFKNNDKTVYMLMSTKITKELAVSKLQPAVDEVLKNYSKSEIDYIHGAAEVFRLGNMENSIGILLPPVAKDSFFATINSGGPLPRKSFSMGEADEKRFYIECRKLKNS